MCFLVLFYSLIPIRISIFNLPLSSAESLLFLSLFIFCHCRHAAIMHTWLRIYSFFLSFFSSVALHQLSARLKILREVTRRCSSIIFRVAMVRQHDGVYRCLALSLGYQLQSITCAVCLICRLCMLPAYYLLLLIPRPLIC